MSIFDIQLPGDISACYSSAGEDSSQSERSNGYIYKQYGGFNKFMISYGLKIWNHDDVGEAKAIATEMRRGDEQDAREANTQSHNELASEAQQQRQLLSNPACKHQAPSKVE